MRCGGRLRLDVREDAVHGLRIKAARAVERESGEMPRGEARHQRRDDARAEFEAGLRELVPGCRVALFDRLVEPVADEESIYFAVPAVSGVKVRATFEPGHQATSEELKLLRAAAALASVIMHSETQSLMRRIA